MANNYYDLQYTGNKVIQWKNYSDTSTPLSAANLQKSHQAINDVDQAVRAAFQNVDNTKFDKTNAAQMLSGVTYNDQTGVMVFKHYDNSIPDIIFNTNLQKLVVNFSYDPNTQSLLLTQSDGTIVSVDLSAFVSNPDLTNSNTIAWTINQDGSVSANIINNSITDEMMESHYLASIMTIGGQAQQSALNADYNAKLAKSYANGTSGLPDRPNEHIDNADYYRQLAHGYASISGSYMRIAGQNAEDAEAWAWGKRNGQPVPSTDPQYNNSAEYWADKAREIVIEGGADMEGATASTDGKHGYAPKPLAGQQDDLLTGRAQYKSLDQLGIQKQVLASAMTIGGQTVTQVEPALRALNEKPSIASYNDLSDKPQINSNTLTGNKTGSDLGLQNIVLSSALSIGGQTITEVEPALRALNEKGGGHTILDEDGITYPQRSKLQFEGCEITDDAVNGVTVVKCEGGGVKKYAKPVITVGTYTYDGTTQAPTITGFDANVMTLTGTHEAINAGSYTFTIALSDKTSSKWTDDTQDDIVTNWSIDAISVAVPTVTGTTKTYNGSAQSPTITRDTANTSISGTTSATKVKSNYSFSIALTDTTNHKWSDNTTAAKSYTWKINPPTGSSYTPVNNIQAWLQCASIDKTYTTIAQVLADATTLSALMLSNNAVDYLVRSTSWVSNITGNQTAMIDIGASDYCADKLLANSTWRTAICDSTYFEKVLNVKVPTMTSNTTPSGVANTNNPYTDYEPYRAFDGNDSTYFATKTVSSGSGDYLEYDFVNPVDIKLFNIKMYTLSATVTAKIQYYDGSTWIDATNNLSISANATMQTFVIDNGTSALKWRIYKVSTKYSGGDRFPIYTLQFYGRASS